MGGTIEACSNFDAAGDDRFCMNIESCCGVQDSPSKERNLEIRGPKPSELGDIQLRKEHDPSSPTLDGRLMSQLRDTLRVWLLEEGISQEEAFFRLEQDDDLIEYRYDPNWKGQIHLMIE